FRKWWRQLESGREVFYRRMTAIIVASAVLVFACVYYGSHLPDGEPFALWEGISAWPTEILRAVAIVLAIWLLFDAESHLCTNAAKIRGDYFGPEHRGERNGTGGVAESSTIGGLFRRVRESMPRASGIVAKHKTALSAWKAYERNERLGRRLSSVSWFILLFVAPCCLAYLFFGWPMKPVRGTFCWVIDFVFELAA